MPRLTITALAAALDLSREMVYKLASKGMPTDSIENARTWRHRNLDPGRTKRYRLDGNPGVAAKRPEPTYYYARDDSAPFGVRRVNRPRPSKD